VQSSAKYNAVLGKQVEFISILIEIVAPVSFRNVVSVVESIPAGQECHTSQNVQFGRVEGFPIS
jgi:hypothetical protein